MNARLRQYGFVVIFLAIGIYQVIKGDYLESSLYFLASFAFIVNNLSTEPALSSYKKILVIATWVLIAITALVFLWVLQFSAAL
jgi:hypothetical protein